MHKFFYIIQRDGQIHEIGFTQERFEESLKQWQKGGLIIFPKLGVGINAVDITNILSADKYQNYVDTHQPKFYIKNGGWYHISDRSRAVRYEKWRQDELDAQAKKEALPAPTEPQVRFGDYKPEFLTRRIKKNPVEIPVTKP